MKVITVRTLIGGIGVAQFNVAGYPGKLTAIAFYGVSGGSADFQLSENFHDISRTVVTIQSANLPQSNGVIYPLVAGVDVTDGAAFGAGVGLVPPALFGGKLSVLSTGWNEGSTLSVSLLIDDGK